MLIPLRKVTSKMAEEDAFTACLKRMSDEIIPLLQSYPPQLKNDDSGMLSGSIDLLLYRNLAFALEFCFNSASGDGRFTTEQQHQLALFVRTKVIPAYVSFFNAHFGQDGEKSFYFFVRQENNSCWAKVSCVWRDSICMIFDSSIFSSFGFESNNCILQKWMLNWMVRLFVYLHVMKGKIPGIILAVI